MIEGIKYRFYDILVETEDNELIDRIVAAFLMVLILINVTAVVLETVDEYNQQYGAVFQSIEIFSVGVFTAEYLLRLWVITYNPKFSKPVTGRIRYALTPMAIIDLIAILPAYLPLFFAFDLRILRILRLFRLFRLLKMNRYVEALNRLDDVIWLKRQELLTITLVVFALLLFASSFIYIFENEAQPDKFPSIPAAMWWGIATLTTVGYGDVYPVTPLGKLLAGLIAFLGVGIFALPAGILASGFAEEIRKKREAADCETVCPHCGRELPTDK
ncbi:MAG: ion transporter [Acidobacteriota bacterium]|nr:ion transporter [Acidobacteriota bacterium]